MTTPTSGKTINTLRDKANRWKPNTLNGIILHYLQTIIPLLRDDGYNNYRILKRNDKLRLKIIRDTNWLAVTTYSGGNSHNLPFHEQAIKYFEYKNMVIQRRAQYVIIFLTLVLLLMTGFEIYLKIC